MSDIQYKCPSCSAPIEYNAVLGRMTCGSCGNTFGIGQVEKFNAALGAVSETGSQIPAGPQSGEAGLSATNGSPSAGSDGQEGESSPMVQGHPIVTGSPAADQDRGQREASYLDPGQLAGLDTLVCDSCGAEIVADPTTISARCGFCNNTFVSTGRITATRIPDFIIPFAIDKEGMLEAFRKATLGKYLLPPAFRDEHTLAEATGAYIPYWYHDGITQGTINYTATKVRSWSDADYDYTETSTYDVVRSGSVQFRGIPVCGTTKLEPERAEGTEPFDLGGAKEFGTAYLSGYAASSYDIDSAQTIDQVDSLARDTFIELLDDSVTGYSNVNTSSVKVDVDHTAIWYALLPVWLIVIAWNGQKYPFAINGQTGEVVGSFPIDKARLWQVNIAVAIPMVLLFGLLGWLMVAMIVS